MYESKEPQYNIKIFSPGARGTIITPVTPPMSSFYDGRWVRSIPINPIPSSSAASGVVIARPSEIIIAAPRHPAAAATADTTPGHCRDTAFVETF